MIKTFKDKPYTKTFILVFFLNMSFFLGINCLKILPAYLENLGASKVYIGFFMNFKSLTLIAYVLFLGKFLGNINRKKPLLTGYLIFFACLIGMSFFYQNLSMLLVFMILASVNFAIGFTMHVAIIHAIIPDNKRVGLFALFGISGLASNPIAAFISERFYLSLPESFIFFPPLFFCIITIIILFLIPDQGVGRTAKSKENLNFTDVLKTRGITPFVISAMIFGGAFGTFATFIPNLTRHALKEVNIFYFFTGFAVIAICIRIITVNFIDDLPKHTLIVTGLFSILVACILAFFLSALWMLFIIGLLYGIGHGLLFPTISSAFVSLAPEGKKHNYSDAFLCTHIFGGFFLTTLIGLVGDLFSVSYIFLSMAFIVLVTVLYLILQRRYS